MGWNYQYTYETMPACEEQADGMRVIAGDTSAYRANLIPEDIVYAAKDGKALHVKMIYPERLDEEKNYPLYIHIQGSAWQKQNLFNHVGDLQAVVRAGYIVAIVEYRPTPDVIFPGQVEDAKDAIRYLAAHAKELGIDASRIFVSGDSSGGHTCLLCWATWESGKLDAHPEQPLPEVRAFVDCYGVVDLEALSAPGVVHGVKNDPATSPETMLLGGLIPSEHPEKARKVSVLTYITEQTANHPLLILHGDKDRLVHFSQSILLYEDAKKHGKDVTFYKVAGADHGGSAFYCEAVMQTLVDYLEAH